MNLNVFLNHVLHNLFQVEIQPDNLEPVNKLDFTLLIINATFKVPTLKLNQM